MMFTAIQKISISIISVMCILMAVFGIFNKQSYNSITTDNSAFDNAVLYDYANFEEEENNFSENINVEYINDQLKMLIRFLLVLLRILKINTNV